MNDNDIKATLEPLLEPLRVCSRGAGDREILEAQAALSAILRKFNYPPVANCVKLANIRFSDALKYKGIPKKNAEAKNGAEYFLDRIHNVVRECLENQASD